MRNSLHQTQLSSSSISLACHLLRWNVGGHDGTRLVEEAVESSQAGSDALRQGAPYHRGVGSHGLQHHTHITDSAPLYRQT